MTYLLDTDVVIPFLAGDSSMQQMVTSLAASGISVSLITYMEVFQGIFASADPVAARAGFETWLASGVPLLPFDETIARRTAQLRADLSKQGRRVRSRALDLIIAATALEHGLTVVTRN
jgi:predicted nucleic acid-binding protein